MPRMSGHDPRQTSTYAIAHTPQPERANHDRPAHPPGTGKVARRRPADHIDRWIADPQHDLPRPIRIGKKAVRFRKDEVDEWLCSLERAGAA
ncbi:MAG: AlpA family phage regulatory protein [Gemmatimonadetes bacterium]|nr:AlpA family phage regulatory protein [Gemmatimonadota bacterium]MYG37034.1 AlpA family phage regulatory protein [Gemmatimonadota bacterium]